MRKYFVLFLILTVAFSYFFAQTAMAGDVINVIDNVVDNVVDVVVDALDVDDISQFFLLNIPRLDPLLIIFDRVFRCDILEQQTEFIADCRDGVIIIPDVNSSSASCYEVPLTFYNQPEMNVDYLNNPNGYCERISIDETGRNIGIYRFTLPGNSSQSVLNDWYYGIKNQVGNGWLSLDNSFYQSGFETSRLAEINYQSMCGGSNTCKFTDASVPEDYYVAYVAKIFGPYGSGSCSLKDNKFIAKTTTGIAGAELDATQINGPYKVPICPLPTVDLKINSSDGPLNFYLPNNNAVLSWTSQYTSSCSVSGDWSGNKPLSGSENLGNLLRGTANPGSGKTYNFSITCDSVYKKGSVTDSVSATVFEYPNCSFGADPSTITLPNSSQLSQTCQYADSCSIDQKIGIICSGEADCSDDGVKVRPTSTTTFTLTCQGLDGQRQWQTTVGIGESGEIKYKEIIPQ